MIMSERTPSPQQKEIINNFLSLFNFQILTAKDYALILGMPGTGKTSTMVHAVKALLIRGSSILLASYTNSAVDNLLIKLKAQVSFSSSLRFYFYFLDNDSFIHLYNVTL